MNIRQKPAAKAPGAELLALQLVAFLTADEARLERFVALTGLGRDDLAGRAAEPEFQAFVIDYALEDESLVLEFAAAHDLRPEALLSARRKLPGAWQ